MGCRRSPGVLLHRGANELIEVEEELTTQVWFVARREYNWELLWAAQFILSKAASPWRCSRHSANARKSMKTW